MDSKTLTKQLKSKLVYLPALLNIKKEMIWDTNFMLYYPAFLRSLSLTKISASINYRKNCFVFADSGGFGLLTGTVDPAIHTSTYIIETANMFADACATLDFPPMQGEQGAWTPVRSDEFDRRLKFSSKNAILMREQKRDDLLLYTVVHGQNWDALNKWYNASDPERESVAYALSPKSSIDITKLSLYLCWAKEIGATYLHMFAISSPKAMMMMEYAIRHSKMKMITFDSTEFSDGSRLRVMISPVDSSLDIVKSSDPVYQRPPCDCPICKNWDWSETLPGWMLDLHNLHVLLRKSRLISALTDKYLEIELIRKIGEENFSYLENIFTNGYGSTPARTLDTWSEV